MRAWGVFNMQVHVHYQGFAHSQWMDQLIVKKVSKLERFLSSHAQIDVFLNSDEKAYSTTLIVHNKKQHYSFSSDGLDLFESFTSASEMATKELSEEKRKLKDRIQRKFSSRDQVA